MTLLAEVLDAHGGVGQWRASTEVSADFRSGGVALATKFAHRPFRAYRATAAIHEPRTVIEPYPTAGRRGIFEAGAVRIEDAATGTLVEARSDPRSNFPGGRRALRWDRLDALYFAGYALWNYLITPFLLTYDGVVTEELEPSTEGWRRLAVTFPAGLPTHSRDQVFYFDDDGLLRRLDYTAEVFGGWAKAAHLCLEHATVGGIPFPVRRRVKPRARNGRPRPFPTLVALDLTDVAIT